MKKYFLLLLLALSSPTFANNADDKCPQKQADLAGVEVMAPAFPVDEVVEKIKDFVKKTGINEKTAGELEKVGGDQELKAFFKDHPALSDAATAIADYWDAKNPIPRSDRWQFELEAVRLVLAATDDGFRHHGIHAVRELESRGAVIKKRLSHVFGEPAKGVVEKYAQEMKGVEEQQKTELTELAKILAKTPMGRAKLSTMLLRRNGWTDLEPRYLQPEPSAKVPSLPKTHYEFARYNQMKPILKNMVKILGDNKILQTELERFWLKTQIHLRIYGGSEVDAMKAVLAEEEARAGFEPAVDLETNKTYEPEDWRKILRQGKPFNDYGFSNPDPGEREYHHILTHRLHFYLFARVARTQPHIFYKDAKIRPSLPEVMKFMGTESFHGNLKWETGAKAKVYGEAQAIWNSVVDSPSEQNATCPEWLAESYNHYVSGMMY